MSSPIVAICFARAKLSMAGSVNLSDWLGGDKCILIRTRFRTDSIILEAISKTVSEQNNDTPEFNKG
jgi:hypothetical protein